MVDLASTLSFLTAPVLGYLNLRAVTGKNVSKENQPKLWLKVLSWVGLIVLTGFGFYFIFWRIFLI